MTFRSPPWALAGAHPAETVRQASMLQLGAPFGAFAGGVGAKSGGGHGVGVGVDELAVTANGAPNMSVWVAGGACSVRGTESPHQGCYLVYNDAPVNLAIGAAHATLARRDLIVDQVRDAAYSGVATDVRPFVVAGTAAAGPVDPVLPPSCLVLARVTVAAAVASITNAAITDLRTRAGTGGRIGCALRRTAVTNFPVGVQQNYQWTTEIEDTDDFHTAGNPDRITIPAGLGGIYAVTFHMQHAAPSGAQMILDRNGLAVTRQAFTGPLDTLAWTGPMAAGDYLTASFYSSTTANDSLGTVNDVVQPFAPQLTCYKVG